jgi:hypothetical protein
LGEIVKVGRREKMKEVLRERKMGGRDGENRKVGSSMRAGGGYEVERRRDWMK